MTSPRRRVHGPFNTRCAGAALPPEVAEPVALPPPRRVTTMPRPSPFTVSFFQRAELGTAARRLDLRRRALAGPDPPVAGAGRELGSRGGDDHLADPGVLVAADLDRDGAAVALAVEHRRPAEAGAEARHRGLAGLEGDLGPPHHAQPQRPHRLVHAVEALADLAAGGDRADAPPDRREEDQRAADQQRHEAFEEVDRGDGEEDQQGDQHPEPEAAPAGVPHLAAGADRGGVDRLHRQRRPEVLFGHRRRVVDRPPAFRRGPFGRARVAAGDPLQVGALQGEEDDEEDGDDAEDQPHRQLRVRFSLPGRGRDHDRQRRDDEDADQPEPPRALESPRHRAQPTRAQQRR